MDDDDKEPEDESAESARDAAQEEGAKLREVSGEDLKQILAAHKTWLETDGEKGKRADLSEANLQEAHLFHANLQAADLRGANLQGADLLAANLQGADLDWANFEGEADSKLAGANLTGANLQNANLSDAKLSDVTGLLADKLAGANLSNAKVPENIAAFDGLARVEEISRIARPIFIGLLAGCVYSWLTIATTTDARLLTNSASSPLPIIGTEIPIAGFYWMAPILLLGVYVYLHLYLQRLWEGLADLPAVFPDGKPLNKKVYPWLLSGLVRAHFKLLKDQRPLLSRLENWATIFLAWWIVPVTVVVFWLRYLPRHEWFGTGLHVALLILSIGGAILLHRHAGATLRRDVTAFRWRRPWFDRRTYQAAVAVGLGLVVALVSLSAIEGDARRDPPSYSVVLGGIATWVPTAFDRMGYRTFANLREANVSTKPATWTGLAERRPEEPEKLDKTLVEKARAEFAQVKGAPLRGADLRHADAFHAFLAKADLRDAKLQGAYLRAAHLQDADLRRAKLQGADLRRAELQGADLSGAQNLTREQLDGACGDDETTLPDYLADYQMKLC